LYTIYQARIRLILKAYLMFGSRLNGDPSVGLLISLDIVELHSLLMFRSSIRLRRLFLSTDSEDF
jgi:hypothetical protein